VNTVTAPAPARPAYGTVERFAEIIREAADDRHQTYVAERSLIDFTIEVGTDAAAQLDRIRNILAAGELVREELAQS
jgi:hypothetical protein